ncbi:hypothetical protein Hanom_Chr00s004647g01724331 [Helianthus anomalus]
MENRTGNVGVHVSMQENDVGGGYVSKVAGDKSHGEEGQSFDFNIHVTKSVCQTGGVAQNALDSFKLRKSFLSKPNKKCRRSSLKNRPSMSSGGINHDADEIRPRKRPRSVLEGLVIIEISRSEGNLGAMEKIKVLRNFSLI